jgi:hypothetical protein
MTAFLKAFTVYGTFYGSDELPDALATFDTRAEAELYVSAYPDSDPIVEYDCYLISESFGDSIRFTSDAMLSGA